MKIYYGTPPSAWISFFPPVVGMTSGPTASRPVSPAPGHEHFDTDMGITVWWNDAAQQWVNITGASQ